MWRQRQGGMEQKCEDRDSFKGEDLLRQSKNKNAARAANLTSFALSLSL